MTRFFKCIGIIIVSALVLALIASTVSAQPRMGPGPARGYSEQQGNVPGVQTLTPEQRRQIATFRQQTQERVQAVRRDPNLTQQQRNLRIEEIQREGHERVLSVLTQEQRDQFEHWWTDRPRGSQGMRGPGMRTVPRGPMSNQGYVPGVSDLTEAQMDGIAAIRRDTQQRTQSVRSDPNLTPQQRAERIAQIQREGHERVMAALTDDQRAQFQRWWAGRVTR